MKIFLRVVTSLTTAAIVVAAILCAPVSWFRPVVSVLAALTLFEYGQLIARKLRPWTPKFLLTFIAGAAFLLAALSFLPLTAEVHGAKMLLYVVAIVKFSDMGGFAIGMSTAKMMKGGNHKMCPSVSPSKSWEGLAGSLTASILMSLAFMSVTGFGIGKTLAFGVGAAFVGTAGDLVESKLKRWAGVKDSATFMPAGLGGFLDMIDSLLFAPALFYWFL